MDVHIWSDIVCPWCYLGKRRFEHALALFDHRDQVRVTHRSFQLDPTRPKHVTMNRRQMLMAKYHLTEEQVAEMDGKMERTAALEAVRAKLPKLAPVLLELARDRDPSPQVRAVAASLLPER